MLVINQMIAIHIQVSMAGSDKDTTILSKINRFRLSENPKITLVREILFVLLTVGAVVALLLLICGTWPAVVTIESESMVPNMNVGDLVLVVSPDRYGALESRFDNLSNYLSDNPTGLEKYALEGDVIIYQPNGNKGFDIFAYLFSLITLQSYENNNIHPIIHRALFYVESGEKIPVTIGGQKALYTTQHEGYITKGDNNPTIDQVGWSNYRGLGGPLEPVRKDWIIGKALVKIPYIGYIPLYIKEVIIIVAVIMILHELYLRSRSPVKKSQKKMR